MLSCWLGLNHDTHAALARLGFYGCICRSWGERNRGGKDGASLAWGPPWGPPLAQGLCSVCEGELADIVMLLGAVGTGPQGETCRRDGLGISRDHSKDRGTSSACSSPPGDTRPTGGAGWGGCWPTPSAGGGRGARALTAEVGQHAAVPPIGTVPGQPTGDVVLVPIRPLPFQALCREKGSQAWSR